MIIKLQCNPKLVRVDEAKFFVIQDTKSPWVSFPARRRYSKSPYYSEKLSSEQCVFFSVGKNQKSKISLKKFHEHFGSRKNISLNSYQKNTFFTY